MEKNRGENNLTAQKLHSKAEQARESDNHQLALELLDGAILKYQKDGNYSGVAEALQSRVLTFRHLFFQTDDFSFAIIAQKEAEASLEIARKHAREKISSSYFRLGECAMLFKNYSEAVLNYQEAIDTFDGSQAEKGDYRYHLGEALVRAGRREIGMKIFLKGLSEIEQGRPDVDPFLANVWQSGAHMKLADLLRDDQPEEARKHFAIAKEIADSDPKLVIRRRQIAELESSFS